MKKLANLTLITLLQAGFCLLVGISQQAHANGGAPKFLVEKSQKEHALQEGSYCGSTHKDGSFWHILHVSAIPQRKGSFIGTVVMADASHKDCASESDSLSLATNYLIDQIDDGTYSMKMLTARGFRISDDLPAYTLTISMDGLRMDPVSNNRQKSELFVADSNFVIGKAQDGIFSGITHANGDLDAIVQVSENHQSVETKGIEGLATGKSTAQEFYPNLLALFGRNVTKYGVEQSDTSEAGLLYINKIEYGSGKIKQNYLMVLVPSNPGDPNSGTFTPHLLRSCSKLKNGRCDD